MRINYNKSVLLTLGLGENESNMFARLFGCKRSGFPINYLGVPLHHSKLRTEDIQPIVDKIIKRIAGWRGRHLSYGGRLTLIKACLASIPTYLMSIIKFPKWAIENINTQMANFFWNDQDDKHKYRLANIQLISQKKEFGGLGIPDLGNLNMCLLASWIARYHLRENVLWREIVDHKYRTDKPNLLCCPELGASPFWKGVLWAAKAAQMGYQWEIGDGRTVRFWEDQWFGSCSLAIQFWPFYVLINEQGNCVVDLWDGVNLKFTFRRTVPAGLMRMWEEITSIAQSITFTDDSDAIFWKFESNGRYSVQSLYSVISFKGVKPIYTLVMWKLTIPPRIHIFWLVANNRLLTRDNLAKRRHLDDTSCLFSCENESIIHLLFDCCVAKLTWSYISSISGFTAGTDFMGYLESKE